MLYQSKTLEATLLTHLKDLICGFFIFFVYNQFLMHFFEKDKHKVG